MVKKRHIFLNRAGAQDIGEVAHPCDSGIDQRHIVQLRVENPHCDRRFGQGTLRGQHRGAHRSGGNDQIDGWVVGQGTIVGCYSVPAPRSKPPMSGEEVDLPVGAHHPENFFLELSQAAPIAGCVRIEIEQQADVEIVLVDLGPCRRRRRQQRDDQDGGNGENNRFHHLYIPFPCTNILTEADVVRYKACAG